MRFDLARAAGLTEDHVELVTDGHDAADLPPDWHAALRLADRLITDPSPLTSEERTDLGNHFSPADQAELALSVGLFVGFSKLVIALGLEPEHMDVTVLPTPSIPEVG